MFGKLVENLLPIAAGVGTGLATGNPMLGFAAYGAANSLTGSGPSLMGTKGGYVTPELSRVDQERLGSIWTDLNNPANLTTVNFGGNRFQIMPRALKDLVNAKLSALSRSPQPQYQAADPGLIGRLAGPLAYLYGLQQNQAAPAAPIDWSQIPYGLGE